MITTYPIVRVALSSIVILLSVPAYGNEPFYVFAPDKKNQQVLRIVVETTTDGIAMKVASPIGLSFGPTSIAIHPDGKHLIVTAVSEGKSPVATLEINKDGELNVTDRSILEQPSGYTSVDRSGRYFMTANYGEGIVSVYQIQDDSRVGKLVYSVQTPRAEAHCVLTTRDNRFAYVPCVKTNNALYQFAFDETTGKLSPLDRFDASPPPMFGPRHVAYHPTLPIAYFSNEQQLGVSVYQIETDGQLIDIQHVITTQRRSPFEQGKRDLHASDLVVTADGTRLFVAVRDFNGDEDSVYTFQIASDGMLTRTHRTMVGDIPWKLNLSPDEKHLLVSEAFEQRLSILEINKTGSLTPAGQIKWNAEVWDMVVVQPR